MNNTKFDFGNRLIDESKVAHVNLSMINYEPDIIASTAMIKQYTSH